MRNEWNLRGLVTASILAIAVCIGFSAPASALHQDFGFYPADTSPLTLTNTNGAFVFDSPLNGAGTYTWDMSVTNNSGQDLYQLYVIVPDAGKFQDPDYTWDDTNTRWIGTDLADAGKTLTLTTGFTTFDTSQTPWLQAKVNGINGEGNFTTGDFLSAVHFGYLADGATANANGLQMYATGWPVGGTISIGIDFNAAAVPEPTTALLLACGLAGLAAAGRRRSLH